MLAKCICELAAQKGKKERNPPNPLEGVIKLFFEGLQISFGHVHVCTSTCIQVRT